VISDAYVIQHLLEATSDFQAGIVWQENSAQSAGFVARLGDVQLLLEQVHNRAGSRLVLQMRHALDEFCIVEPLACGRFGQKYSNKEQQDLAILLRSLMRAAALQCRHRRQHALTHAEEIRERICRHLLFEQPDSNPTRSREARAIGQDPL
jgi:hypothetical protein